MCKCVYHGIEIERRPGRTYSSSTQQQWQTVRLFGGTRRGSSSGSDTQKHYGNRQTLASVSKPAALCACLEGHTCGQNSLDVKMPWPGVAANGSIPVLLDHNYREEVALNQGHQSMYTTTVYIGARALRRGMGHHTIRPIEGPGTRNTAQLQLRKKK